MIALLSSSLWLALGPVVTVASEAACPTAEDVAVRVSALLAARETSEAPDVARIVERGDTLLVTLARADGTPIGERALDRRYPCPDLAAAAAVIVAAWESDVHPEFRVEEPAAPAPAAAPVPAAPPPPAPPVVLTASPEPGRPAPRFDLGAALTGSLAPSSSGAAPALGAVVAASWVPSHLGARVAVSASAGRDLPLGGARVRWRRVAAALGPVWRLTPAAAWAVDLHADAVAAWATAAGVGFTTDHDASALDGGLGAGARLAWLGGRRLFPWVEMAGAGWLRPPTAYATPGGAAVVLPRGEITLALGVSLRGLP